MPFLAFSRNPDWGKPKFSGNHMHFHGCEKKIILKTPGNQIIFFRLGEIDSRILKNNSEKLFS